MASRPDYLPKSTSRQAIGRNRTVNARASNLKPRQARRTLGGVRNVRAPFAPPEDWHEYTDAQQYRVVEQPPGEGYGHVVTPGEVRERLSQLPKKFLDELEVVQLSRMTRKKQCFPCYGMQWGNALYLYPLENSLVERFYRPPNPNVVNEAKMFGGRWEQPEPQVWTLTWTTDTARDFYLNNILIHELGHLLDERNSSYTDRERYAEWFAIEYGYLSSGGKQVRQREQNVRRRHHAT